MTRDTDGHADAERAVNLLGVVQDHTAELQATFAAGGDPREPYLRWYAAVSSVAQALLPAASPVVRAHLDERARAAARRAEFHGHRERARGCQPGRSTTPPAVPAGSTPGPVTGEGVETTPPA